MANEKKSAKTSFRFDPATLESFRVRCVQRGNMQQSDAIQDAVVLWLEKTRDNAAAGTNGTTPVIHESDSLNSTSGEYALWVNRLIAVLASKNKAAINLIHESLSASCLIAGISVNGVAGDHAATPDIVPTAAGALNNAVRNAASAEQADREAKHVIGEHKRDRRDSRGRQKGAA